MSYDDHLSQWSACSVSDFTAHYTNLADSWCMPESTAASTACGDTSTTTEEPTTTTEEPTTTTEDPATTTEVCEDIWSSTLCARKESKGRCSNSNVITNC